MADDNVVQIDARVRAAMREERLRVIEEVCALLAEYELERRRESDEEQQHPGDPSDVWLTQAYCAQHLADLIRDRCTRA